MGLWMLSCIHHIFQIQVAILLLQLRIRPPGKQMPSPYPADKTLPENGLLLHPHHGSMVRSGNNGQTRMPLKSV